MCIFIVSHDEREYSHHKVTFLSLTFMVMPLGINLAVLHCTMAVISVHLKHTCEWGKLFLKNAPMLSWYSGRNHYLTPFKPDPNQAKLEVCIMHIMCRIIYILMVWASIIIKYLRFPAKYIGIETEARGSHVKVPLD